MGPAIVVFVVTMGLVVGGFAVVSALSRSVNRRQLDERLHDTTFGAVDDSQPTVVKRTQGGPIPELDRWASRTGPGSRLMRLIEQSGTDTTPSAVCVATIVTAIVTGGLAAVFLRQPIFAPLVAVVGAALPVTWLRYRRARRLKRFEEQFPEALDLLSRALRAGHAFQTALGMAADELREPVGPELKKTFEQQNFGLPLRDALNELAHRVTLLDVRFFVTAVLIQRDTGGNLAEILDNLAHVVRERFKIRRQVRVHTAHGRFTAFVLLSLPPALGIVLSFINHEHMDLLFREHIGQMMLLAAVVMQTVGFLWIRHVIRIEV